MGIIVVPITAGVGCPTGILVKLCPSCLKKEEQKYKLKYAINQKTLDDFRQLFTASPKDNHTDGKKYHRFVNMYENYRAASRRFARRLTITKYNKQVCEATRTASRYNNADYSTDIAYAIA